MLAVVFVKVSCSLWLCGWLATDPDPDLRHRRIGRSATAHRREEGDSSHKGEVVAMAGIQDQVVNIPYILCANAVKDVRYFHGLGFMVSVVGDKVWAE